MVSDGNLRAAPASLRTRGSNASKPPLRYACIQSRIVSAATCVRVDPGIVYSASAFSSIRR